MSVRRSLPGAVARRPRAIHSGPDAGPRVPPLARVRARRVRAAAVSLATAIAFAVGALLTAGASPVAVERHESLALQLDAIGPDAAFAHRVVRVPTPVRVTDVVVTTDGPHDLAWTVELCPRDERACLPVSSALVDHVLPDGLYDLRVDVDHLAGAVPALGGHLALAPEPLPEHDLARIAWFGAAACAAALVGAFLLRPTDLHPADLHPAEIQPVTDATAHRRTP